MPHNENSKNSEDFASLVRLYLASPKFTGYSRGTQAVWGRELAFASRPACLGKLSLQAIRPALVQAYLDGLAGRPGKQAMAYSALKQLEKWAIVRDLLPRPIMTGVETERPQGGHLPWTDEEVELAEQHARPDVARAVTLAACTGQRGSDLIRMCPTDLEVYNGLTGINVTQKKTGRKVWVPITSTLAKAMETWELRPGPYLTRLDGSPWTRTALTHAWYYELEHNAGLKPLADRGLVLHGLRGTACVRLRQSGATIPQIADMVGMSAPMVERYCRFSMQRENATAAVIHLESRLSGKQVRKEDARSV